MARKVITYKVDAEGRDQGKSYVITEMPATAGQRWALRAFLALARNGIQVPDNVKEQGLAAFAKLGFQLIASLPFEEADYLFDELMACVQMNPSGSITRKLREDDIEEIMTRFTLCKEVFALHVDFLKVAKPSTPASADSAAATQS
jgi:hypothetical protein